MDAESALSHNVKIQLRAPTFQATDDSEGIIALQDLESGKQGPASEDRSSLKQRGKSVAIDEDPILNQKSNPDVYFGSYGRTSEYARSSRQPSVDARSKYGSAMKSPRASTSNLHLQHLLRAVDVETETYGLSELRDGFFDALFYRPLPREKYFDSSKEYLPTVYRKYHPLSLRRFVPQQWREFTEFISQLQEFSRGIRMLRSFLGFYIAYIICLIPASRDWLGKYNYIMVVSTIINHAGRPVGSQFDGALMTVLGTLAGLGWGSLALYVSTSTGPARQGYGGVLATCLVIFAAAIAWFRCMFMRFYQAMLCAGFAICYTCLADTSETISWRKIFNYGIPWLLGQAVCLLVACVIFPDTGSRSLALAFQDSFELLQKALDLPREENPDLTRDLAWTFVKLSGAVRDFTIDLTISRYHPDDARSLRNLIQGVIRGVLSIRPETTLFDVTDGRIEDLPKDGDPCAHDNPPSEDLQFDQEAAMNAISELLATPARELIDAMIASIKCSNKTLTQIGGLKASDLVLEETLEDLPQALERLQASINAFDAADSLLLQRPELPSAYAAHPKIVEIFLFVHPIRQAADKVQDLLRKVIHTEKRSTNWRVNWPTYPFIKSLNRVNAQVRHDRGGLTAGFFFRTKQQIEKTMADLQSTTYVPSRRSVAPANNEQEKPTLEGNSKNKSTVTARYRLLVWRFLHRLQGFESRFAFKVALVTTLLSIPAWLEQSSGWWNDNESWWAVVTVWMMMHPRVGGTFQDLGVRSLCAALGAICAGFGWAAADGNPYVIAIFAALFMFPMLHRFTQSSHPRSGIAGCISFTVVSLGAYTAEAQPSITKYTWTRGVAFIVGIFAALLANWILWPFVARHELRKSVSTMMLHSAVLYRGVVARYIYYAENNAPGPADIERSEMLEGRLREGFVRIRQLLELTGHEIRLRGPFDPLPYSALIDACERFFERLVEVRQSSIYFQPFMLARGVTATDALFEVRRDAVAVILLNLYALACALRADQPVPRYLPSAAAARQRLLDRMDVVEVEHQEREKDNLKLSGVEPRSGTGRRWADVYQFAFSSALTDIVEELQLLQRWTKGICGEMGFDDHLDIAGDGIGDY